MKVKMTDIARQLGLSKATVSLAMNNKPGVNEETRQKIFQCFEELSRREEIPSKEENVSKPENNLIDKVIKVLFINHNKRIIVHPEMDLWSAVIETFDIEARKRGALYSMSYLEENSPQTEDIIRECNMDMVYGVIVFGTEMQESDHVLLEKIKKPFVIYDYETPDGDYCSVCIDNTNAVKMAVDKLKNAGVQDIRYLSTGKTIYNFTKRREAFWNNIKGLEYAAEDPYIVLGGTINEITQNALEWLEENELPEAFLLENYQISIGVMLALKKKGVSVPDDIKMIGIDEVPEYMLSGNKLTYLKMPYRSRATICMKVLDMLIEQYPEMKTKIFIKPTLISNDSI